LDKKLIQLLICIAIGVILYFIPAPEGLSPNAWKFFAIFVAVVCGLVMEPIPPAMVGLIGVVVCGVLLLVAKPGETATTREAITWMLSGYKNTVIWLIFVAFSFAKGYQKSGLGRRIALFAVKRLGRKSLGLGYAVAISDLVLAPFMPSNTARSAGTIYPIIQNIPPLYNSNPGEESRRKIGSYIMWVAIATTCITSSMFITSLAPNLLALNLASTTIAAEKDKQNNDSMTTNAAKSCEARFEKCIADQDKGKDESKASPAKPKIEPILTWGQWMISFLPVGIILFLLCPLITYIIYKPTISSNEEVPKWASDELQKMGKISRNEIIMALSAILALLMWVFGKQFFGGIHSTSAAFIVFSILLLTKVITWEDVLSNKAAWNVLIWFATLVTLASGLKTVGFLSWFANLSGAWLEGYSVNTIMIGLVLIFFFLHYFFASVTAHTTALLPIFVALAAGIHGMDPVIMAVMLMLTLGLMGVITPYATGPSPVYFGSGYITSKEYWFLGAIFGIIYIAIMLIIGMPWIKYYIPNFVA